MPANEGVENGLTRDDTDFIGSNDDMSLVDELVDSIEDVAKCVGGGDAASRTIAREQLADVLHRLVQFIRIESVAIHSRSRTAMSSPHDLYETPTFPMNKRAVARVESVGEKLVGRTIIAVEMNVFDPDPTMPQRKKRSPTADPVFVLDDGTRVVFAVHETDCGEYGVMPVRHGAPKKSSRKRTRKS